MKRFMLLLLSATLLSGGCASQKQASATHAGHAAYRTALAALESQRFVVNLDEVYTRKGQKLDSHQSYLRMQGAFAEFCFAPDFFTPRNGHIMSRLRMPDEQKNFCDAHGIRYEEHKDFTEEIINQTDILYMTRVQRERFTDLEEYERVKNVYILRNDMLKNSRENLRILHPLPRVNEIAYDVDDNPKAYYIQQARNGLFARQAIICDVLGISIND